MPKFEGYARKTIYAIVSVEADTAEQAEEAIRDGLWDSLDRDEGMDDYDWEFDDSFNVREVDDDDE